MALSADIQKQSVDGLVTLYCLDARRQGGDVYYFHNHHSDVITFKGKDYAPTAVQSIGLETRGDGKASTPSLVFDNKLGEHWGGMHALTLQRGDFVGAVLTVYTTLAKYLTGPNPEYKKQIWYVEQKKRANSQIVEFELSNPVDFGQSQIPVRMIGHHCHWAMTGGYRGECCGYTGTAMYTVNNEPTDNPALDRCNGWFDGCEIRHGKGNPLPFGGYPAAGLI